jgi:ribonucleotide reductase alpha subunit/intein/homing endonuclease
MRVLKRDGTYQDVHFDKITARISHLAHNLSVDSVLVAQKVCGQLIDGIKTCELDEISAQNCMSMYTIHPDYSTLGGRIIVDNHKKNTPVCIGDVTNQLAYVLNEEYVDIIQKNKDKFNDMIDFERDFLLDYFGMKTLMRSYLMKNENKNIVERPQHMWMRISIFLHRDNFDLVKETYDYLSTKHFTHASPTLFNAGTKRPQLSSCFIKGTLVDTVNKGPVPIDYVEIGDSVVTHMGRSRRVLQKHVNPLEGRNIYKVNLYNTRPFDVTGNHRLWSYNCDTLKKSWKCVDELTNRDYIGVPKMEFSQTSLSFKQMVDKYIFEDKRIMEYNSWKLYENMPSNSLINTPEYTLTSDLMWLLGVLMASSYPIYTFTDYKGDDKNCHQHITGIKIDNFNNKVCERIITLLGKYFYIDSKSIHREQEDTILHVYNLFVGIILEYITSNLVFAELSKELVNSWLTGYIDGSTILINDSTTITINVSKHSLTFLNSVYSWLRMNQIDVGYPRVINYSNISLCVMDVGVIYNQLHVEGEFTLSNKIRYIDQLYVRVEHISLIQDKHTHVYTLGVEEDHSYGICGIIAENCFLTTIDDSVDGIFKTLSDCAQISKWAGGIGINISDVRGNNSVIRGTNGHTSGIMPLLKTYNATGRYINQCFIGSTIIYTRTGPKTIKTIKPGDAVLTKDGTYKDVKNVFTRSVDESIIKIRNSYTFESIKCTNDHQLYVSKDDGKTFEYQSAQDVCVNDMMVIPVPTQCIDDEVITKDICRLYGIILTSGYSIKNKCYTMTISKKYTSTINFIRSTINNLIEEENSKTNSIVFVFTLESISSLTHDFIYPYEKTKAIHNKFLNLPLDKLLHVLYGIFETKINLYNKSSNIYFVSSNRMFIESIRFAFIRFKTLTFGNKLYTCKAYCIKIPLTYQLIDLCKLLNMYHCNSIDDSAKEWVESGNNLLTRVKSVNVVHYKGNVYDLEVDENRNYTTHMGLVHNSGKRLGSFAMYIEPWHTDIFDFLNAKKAVGAEEERARDLFYGLWIPDLFMERVKTDGTWSLMCPDECKGLTSVYGNEFEKLYTEYENNGMYRRQVKARHVWDAIIESQIESGNPYMLYKDHVNRKNPQENIGVIKQSNLCTEIVLYTDNDHISVCNLASIALPSFLTSYNKFDYEKLERVTRIITRNLNKVIDFNYYPVKEAENTNKSHRPIGIGVQGLADLFAILKIAFDSPEARELNKCIFECIYYSSLSESCKLSEKDGPYDYFENSPMSKGILQFDMWGLNNHPSNRYDWDKLKADIMKHGLRNSTLLAPMPTASTSQILGFNECLTGDTMVTDIQGIARPLVDIDVDTSILSYADTFNNLVTSSVTEFLHRDKKPVFKVTLCSGQTIECTSNHKFRVIHNKTKQYEWLEAENLTRDYSLVMGLHGIDGLEYEKVPFNIKLFQTMLNDDSLTVEKCLAISRLLGFVQGDGNYITNDETCLNVDTLYDSNLLLVDLELIDPSKTFTITDNELNFTIKIGKPITNYLCKLLNNCTAAPLPHSAFRVVVPSIFMDETCSLSAIREFIAGYCGADGIAPYLSWVETHPVLSGCSILRAVHSNVQDVPVHIQSFMNDVLTLFRRLNISATMDRREYTRDLTFVDVFHLNTNEIDKFCNYVGYAS